ncbi:hypothetical protein [Bradyrhizobium sp. dw_78]|uniref:hypothetical protein n=1 Tax=Bradyrhizobium sp. dw_78 TaxID=2719793 RepID=UPI001BD1C571|nr:hypothetical protein [Bradyrhizobium sp. dw_78]
MEDETVLNFVKTTGDDDRQASQWHVQKGIPISLLFALALQTGAFVWWASRTEQRVSDIEIRLNAASNQPERLARVEEKIDSANSGIADIKTYLRNNQKAALP